MAVGETYDPGKHPDLPPPLTQVGVLGWLRQNLFSSPLNIGLTALGLFLIWLLIPPLIEWSVTSSIISGNNRIVCDIGRFGSRFGEAAAAADLQRLDSPQTTKNLSDAQDYLRNFNAGIAKEDAVIPADLASILTTTDTQKVAKDLDEAINQGDAERIAADFRIMQPIVGWSHGYDGACWTFIKVWFKQLMYGLYPVEQLWRINLAFAILIIAAAPLFFQGVPGKRYIAGFLLLLYPLIAFYLFYGGAFGLEIVETRLWGGLFLTLVIAGVGIVASLPIGIVLALGRRSHMPIVRAICVAFIELWRGVPLISVLFMASVMFPLFLPEGVNFDQLVRALAGVALFSSAYMAEVVRGGLQAIPKGQYEAAEAMGLSYWKSMGLIIMPQALKLVIPGIVNTFIGLFKDTTLVVIIGLVDLLGATQRAGNDKFWVGFSTEGYAFAAFGFWIFCFGMSRYSQYVERKLETGHKR